MNCTVEVQGMQIKHPLNVTEQNEQRRQIWIFDRTLSDIIFYMLGE